MILVMPELLTADHIPEGDTRTLTSFSYWNSFRNCRKAAKFRYMDGLRPIDRPAAALAQGDATHQALEFWYRTGDRVGTLMTVNQAVYGDLFPNEAPPELHARWHQVNAMMLAYMDTYPSEGWEVVALEAPFTGEIINPATGASSRSFVLGGKVDGIIKTAEGFFVLEHKTTSRMDGGYLERLWMDLQIQLYSTYYRPEGQPITGVIYNILQKPSLDQRGGETDEEFEARKLTMVKPGAAKQKIAESDDEFQARLAEWYAAAPRFHRETIYFTPRDQEEMRAQLWELTQQCLEAQRSPDGIGFYRNTSQCFVWNRPCEYLPMCRSHESAAVREAYYTCDTFQSGDIAIDSELAF